MTPINLEDVEEYLINYHKNNPFPSTTDGQELWLRDRFAELRAREAAVLKTG